MLKAAYIAGAQINPMGMHNLVGDDEIQYCGNSVHGNSLPLVPALEHLIDAVGTSEPHLFASLTENDYQQLVAILDGLIDIVGENEAHILASLMDFIGTLIENYEDAHVPELSEI